MARTNQNDSNRRNNGANERRRTLISINNQIDNIQDVYFRNYTQNIDRRLSSLAERQSRMLSQLYDNIDREERNRIQKSFADRQEALRRSLDDWRDYNNTIRSNLTLADRFASDVFYWNRRRNLRDLEREARYRFDDIRDEAEELADDMSKSFDSVADSLRDWATALNVNQIASGLEDTQVSMRDLRVEMQKYIDMSDEQWQSLREQANQFSKDTDYAISNLEYLENMTAIVKFGYDDQELAGMLAEVSSKFEAMTGVAADQLGNVFEVSTLDGMGNEDYVKTLMSQMMKIQQTSGLYTNAEDLLSVYNDNIDNLRNLAGGDNELLASYLDQTIALRTATNASYLDGLDDKLLEIMATPMSEMSDSMLMLGGQQIQQLMQSGDWKSAAEIYTSNLTNYLNKNFNNAAARTEFLNQLGLTDSKLQGKILEGGNIDDFFSSYDQAMTIIDEQANTLNQFVDEWNPQTTALNKLTNKFKTSAVGSFLDDVSNELDITLSEAMLIGSGAISIGKFLAGGVKGLGSLLGKLSGAGSAASGGASAARSFLGFSSGGAGVLNHTFLGSTGNAMMSGTGLLGGLSNVGTSLVAAGGGGTVSGGAAALAGGASIAGGALGGASIISGIADIAAASTQQTWQAEADKATEGAIKVGGTAAAAGVGAAIGSIVPGIGTAVGALVGAGVGGLATLIWGDDWAEQLTDTLDGTKSIKESMDTMNQASANLSKTLSDTSKAQDLIDQCKQLQTNLQGAEKGTEYYNTQQAQLNESLRQLGEIYPEYADSLLNLNDGISGTSDASIEAIQATIDKENELAWARMYNASKDLDIDAAKDQFTKSYEKNQETVEAQEYLDQAYRDLSNWEKQGYISQGYHGNYQVTQEGIDAGISEDFYDYQSSIESKWKKAGYNTATGDGIAWNFTEQKNLQSFMKNMTNNWGATHGTEAAADLAEKEQQLIDGMKSLVGNYSVDDILSLAEDYNNLEPSQQGWLEELAAAYNEYSTTPGFDMPDNILPTTGQLESAAGVDLDGSGNVTPATGPYMLSIDGSHALGLDYVPRDNYVANLHKGEAVLTAEEAEIWRGIGNPNSETKNLGYSSTIAGWTPNDSSDSLSNKSVILNKIDELKEVTESNNEEEDASMYELIDTVKQVCKDIVKAIEATAKDNKASSNSLLQYIMKSKFSNTTSDAVFNFLTR